MQEIIGVIVVNIINAVIVLGGAYAVYFINRLCAYVKIKIDSEAADKALNALYRTTTVTVSALEQTAAKALREDVKYGGASKDELKALAEKAYEEITNVAESVEGVLYAAVDDMHLRGQGTVDIIIASSAGTAGEKLLNEVETACQEIKGVYDNLLIKSAETEAVNISIILRIPNEVSEDGLADEAAEHIREYLKISTNRRLNVLYISELIFYIRKNMDTLVSVKVTEPEGDLILDKNKVIVLGSINVSIERVKAYV